MPASTTAGTPLSALNDEIMPVIVRGCVAEDASSSHSLVLNRQDCHHAHLNVSGCVSLPQPPGPVSVRSHPAPETPGNSIGLEAIIRKALMGKYDDQPEERSSSNAANPIVSNIAAGPISDGRPEDFASQGMNG